MSWTRRHHRIQLESTGEFLRKLRVAIDFRTADPRQGVGTAVLTLAYGLSQLSHTDQEYIFIVLEQNKDFFLPHIGGPCSLITVPSRQDSALGKLKGVLKKLPFVQSLWLALHPGDSTLPASDGTVENLNCDIVHFPAQTAYTTTLPTIYQPWDLQFCHYPEFFSKDDLNIRTAYYGGFCRRADYVCVQTEWTKQDVIKQLQIPAEKIVVIRWGTAFEAYEALPLVDREQICRDLGLPEAFFLYPAVTWPHKNHEQIIRALAWLKQVHGFEPHMVFTGATTTYLDHLQSLAAEAGVSGQLHFLGFVSERQVQAIFSTAKALVFPSRFEGLGLPVLEAFRVGLPVICSSASVLPEVAGGAALLVDPDLPERLARAMQRIVQDESLRAELIGKGKSVLNQYSADRMALEFRHLYAEAARRSIHA